MPDAVGKIQQQKQQMPDKPKKSPLSCIALRNVINSNLL